MFYTGSSTNVQARTPARKRKNPQDPLTSADKWMRMQEHGAKMLRTAAISGRQGPGQERGTEPSKPHIFNVRLPFVHGASQRE